MARHIACLAAAMLTLAIFRPVSALGSSAVVPDDFPTVQGAIGSGVDTVLVREGMYPETPVVDRQLVLIGIGGGKRPRLDGLSLERADLPFMFNATGIAFAGSVAHHAVRRNMVFEFSQCSLEGGFQSGSPEADPEYISLLAFRNCRMSGESQASAGRIVMEADTVSNGGVSWGSDYRINILDCWFQGGPGSAITLSRGTGGIAARNVISNYPRGGGISTAYRSWPDTYVFEDNHITNCGIGIGLVTGSYVEIRNNVIEDCRLGISVIPGEGNKITGNTVLRAEECGINVGAARNLVVEGNVVGYCNDRGICLDSQISAVIRANTVFKNGGSGFEIRDFYEGPITVEKNISFGNLWWGLVAPSGAPIVLRCNDWFGNRLGAVSGIVTDSTDLNVDPMFCNVDNADIRLSSASPLVDAPGCGLIGALGVGCGVTETLFEMLTVDQHADGVLVRWKFSGIAPVQSWLERSETETGPWRRIPGSAHEDDHGYTQLDHEMNAGATYWYRVGWSENREIKYSASMRFTVGKMPLAIKVLPNPSPGPISVEWTLSAANDMDVRIVDLAGREIASIAHARFQAGDHSVHWDGRRSDGSPAPAGWYVARVGGRDMNALHKFLLLR